MSMPAPVPESTGLPALEPELLKRLEADILARGVLVPVFVSESGEVIDGRIRLEIATRHRLAVPKIVVKTPDGDGLRHSLNVYRSQLSREQVRELIAWELRRTPSDSDRAIAGRLGVSDKTVGRMRTAEFPQTEKRVGRDGRARRMPQVHTRSDHQAREAAAILSTLDAPPAGPIGLRQLREAAHREKVARLAESPASGLPSSVSIHECDFRRLEEHTGDLTGTIDLAVLDPPWSLDWCRTHLGDLAAMTARVLRPGGIAAVYSGTAAIPVVLETFGEHLDYHWKIVFPNSVRKIGVRKRGTIMSRYRSVVVYCKDHLPETITDLAGPFEEEEQFHPLGWGQPLAEARWLVEHLSRPGASVIDLTLGSGTVAVAVHQVAQGRSFVGCEIDDRCYRIARGRLA